MKALYISATLFCVMLLSLILSVNYLDKSCNKLNVMNISINNSIKDSDWEKADKNYSIYLKEWGNLYPKFSLFIDHNEIQSVNNELCKLTQYINSKNKDEALASNSVIIFFMEHINKAEKITLENIF